MNAFIAPRFETETQGWQCGNCGFCLARLVTTENTEYLELPARFEKRDDVWQKVDRTAKEKAEMHKLLAKVEDVDESFKQDLQLALHYDKLNDAGRDIIDDLTSVKARLTVFPADVRCCEIRCLRINRLARLREKSGI